MAILVIAEHDNIELKPATLNAVSAAGELGSEINLLVVGSECGVVVDKARKIAAVKKILHCDANHYRHQLAEDVAPLIVELSGDYSHIIAPATTFGKNLLPRAAALLDVQQVSDVSAIVDADTFERPTYAGNAIATVKSGDALKIITIRTTAFEAAVVGESGAVVEAVAPGDHFKLTSFVGEELTETERPELTTAKIIVSGGRGLQGKENFAMLEKLADKLNAAVGASRAAVDAGYVPNDYQVGQTGKVVAPELYIAIGISGAIQHLAGMKDSKVIVAINKDEEAPIFQVADYGWVTDLFTAVPELDAALDNG